MSSKFCATVSIKKPPDDLDDENNNCHRDAEGLEESSRNVRLILRSIDKTVHQVLRLSDLIQDSLHNNTTTTSSTSRQSLASAIIESVMTHLAMPAAVMPVMFPGISNAVSYFLQFILLQISLVVTHRLLEVSETKVYHSIKVGCVT